MVATDRVREFFANAHSLHGSSLELLTAGDVRGAAEKAWEATKKATDALILARRDIEPQQTLETTTELHSLTIADSHVETLIGRYHINLGYLHQECSRLGLCDPIEAAEEYIRETIGYIRDAEHLADSQA